MTTNGITRGTPIAFFFSCFPDFLIQNLLFTFNVFGRFDGELLNWDSDKQERKQDY